MKLRTYVSQQRGRAAWLARAIGVRPVMISQWMAGKSVSVTSALAIEHATGGVVARWDLRPDDWHLIWPELVGTEGAPLITQSAPAAVQPQEDGHE